MTKSFIDSGTLRSRLRDWILRSFSHDTNELKREVFERAFQLGDAEKYRLVHPSWVANLLASDPRADPNLYAVDQYDCEDFAFAARVSVAHRLLTQPPPDGYRIPPAFGFLATDLHVLNFGVGPDEKPYLYDVRTQSVSPSSDLDGSFLAETVSEGWLASVERIRYAFI